MLPVISYDKTREYNEELIQDMISRPRQDCRPQDQDHKPLDQDQDHL